MSLADYGYDPRDPVRGLEIPDKLIRSLGNAPIGDPDQTPHQASWGRNPDLTASERDVLRCLSQGMTTTMAAEALGRADWTVREQIRAARYKLKAKTKTQACCEAIRRELIP